jgi:hypothetical protein
VLFLKPGKLGTCLLKNREIWILFCFTIIGNPPKKSNMDLFLGIPLILRGSGSMASSSVDGQRLTIKLPGSGGLMIAVDITGIQPQIWEYTAQSNGISSCQFMSVHVSSN